MMTAMNYSKVKAGFRYFLIFIGIVAFSLGFVFGNGELALANPFKPVNQAEGMKDSREAILLHSQKPNSAKAHRKRVLEALAAENGRDRSKKGKAVLRVQPRKAAERTNHGFQ